MNLTVQQLASAVPCTILTANLWLRHLLDACEAWGIDTKDRLAMFLAQVAQESGNLSDIEENLNYSAQGLANTWPARYATNPRFPQKTPNALALSLHRKPEKIANATYAFRMGNRGPESGDGWRNRGRGLHQLTGEDNYQAYFTAIGLPPDSNRDLVLEPHYAADSAGWFWHTRNCNNFADKADLLGCTLALNGGRIGLEDGNDIGVDDRTEHYALARRVIVGAV